jgi:hypothetical protein
MLILAAILLSVALSIISINHQASARVCTSDTANAIAACINQQNSNSHDHSTTKSTTPFLLAVPFP